MASHAANFGSVSALPLSAVLAAIPSYPRPVIERLIARMIEHLDEQDGDDDPAEEDDPSGQCDEDGINTGAAHSFLHGRSLDGPGCPISDPGEPEEWALPCDE